MSTCAETHQDWTLCTDCLNAHGDFYSQDRCRRCGFVLASEKIPGGSTTIHDVSELRLVDGCRKCPKQEEAEVVKIGIAAYLVAAWVWIWALMRAASIHSNDDEGRR